jgi:inositol oxygenase
MQPETSTLLPNAKNAALSLFRKAGIEIGRVGGRHSDAVFVERARPLIERHYAQTRDDVQNLKEHYRPPIFGRVTLSQLLERLAMCIDSMDAQMGCASQLTHTLQVVEGMMSDGIEDRDMLITGLIHDIGKVALLVGEDPSNVGGMIRPIGSFEEGVGLDQCILQWNHDEFGYTRFKEHVPDHVAWLIRYHSIHVEDCRPLMDERDARYAREYLPVFARYDNGTKSIFREPETRIEDYRDLMAEYFPDPIPF